MRTLLPLCLLLAGCNAGEMTIKGDGSAPTVTTNTTAPTTNTTPPTTSTTDTGEPQIHTGDTGGTGATIPVEVPDHIVDCNGGGDFTSIQDAIDGAVSGERIGVEPCVYVERIDYEGKTLDIYGIQGSSVTFIDGDDDGTVVNVESGESLGTRLAGFTVMGGDGGDDDDGSAIEVELSSLELEDIVLADNNDSDSVLYGRDAWITATDLVIRDNDVQSDGQSIWTKGGSLTLTRVDIECSGGDQAVWHHNSLILVDSVINCSTGHGIHNYHGEMSLRRNTIWGSESGIYAYDTESTEEFPDNPNEKIVLWNNNISGGEIGLETMYVNLEVTNCVISGLEAAITMLEGHEDSTVVNTSLISNGCGVLGDQPIENDYNAYFGFGDVGCEVDMNPVVTSDPMFVSPPSDLTLQPGSPLINAGHPASMFNDADGSRNDIGAKGGFLPL